MSPQPPFTITSQILNTVGRISEWVGAIGGGSLSIPPRLRRRYRVKSIVGSLAIESNTLSEEQERAFLDGKQVMGSAREVGITPDGVKYHLDKLQKAGMIRHVGATKTGHCEVLE